MTMRKSIFYLFLGTLFACQGQKDEVKSPNGYHLNQPVKMRMREALLEISGIAFTDRDELFAVQDEDGQIFRVAMDDGRVLYSSKFGKKGDYEDVAVTGKQVIVLRSDGVLQTFESSLVGKIIPKVIQQKELLPKGEYEGMFAKNDSVFVLCKECAKDKGGKQTTGHILQLNEKGKLEKVAEFYLRVHEIAELADKPKLHFRPSALAQHPKTKDWYIVSSVNRILVITDPVWKVKEVYPLDPALFLQPEGIAFDSKADLFISNEGDEISNGSVYKFPYQP